MENFREIENKWQKFWDEHPEMYRADDVSDKKKKYVLVEFPYPSGSGLHIGHTFSFAGADVYARFKRMQGFNVMFPMGWDAFGLPTENYAIKMKKKPQDVTKENTDMFRSQMKKLAFSFDWSREVNTTDANYYKWTQWIFIQLFNKGLAYKKEMPINWCPSCKIGLANEEVVDGKCERCGAQVSRRNISQWVVKITDYADKLIDGLKETDFIEKVKQAQIKWIGKTNGVNIDYPIDGDSEKIISCYSTRPDTNFGAIFVVIAPEHEKVMELTTEENKKSVLEYIEQSRKKSELERTELQKEKTGVFTGSYCVNRLTGKKMPIWVSDFVVLTAGTGVVVGVPAHDQRDWDFAKKHGIEIIPVIKPKGDQEWDFVKGPYLDIDDAIVFNSDFLNGMTVLEAKEKIIDYIEEKGFGKRSSNYHLRDWIFSRQHYWGEPIPMIYCEEHGWQPVPEDQLPIKLPEVENYEPTDDGQSPLSSIPGWVDTVCPICSKPAKRETDTMPNWAGSDWYFLRYTDPVNDTLISSQEKMKYWLPIDIYIGGDEHNTLHLLYSRFIYKFLWDLGVVPKEHPEPYFKRISHGVILGPDNQRMSKSRGNVIVPEDVSSKYGVDVVRMYLMFMGPFDSTMAWNENTLMGVKRFGDRFEKVINEIKNDIFGSKHFIVNENEYPEFLGVLNKTIKRVESDTEQFKYNTAIASIMELVNLINSLRVKEVVNNPDQSHRNYLVPSVSSVKKMIKLMAPYAPYISEELWLEVWKNENNKKDIDDSYKTVHVADWPVADEQYLIEDKIRVAIAINGKVRDDMEIDIADQNNKDQILAMAKGSEKIKSWIGASKIIKEIYVPGKMINFVILLDK